MPLLTVRDLSYHYPPAYPGAPDHTTLDGISFDLEAGHTLAVTAVNGGGLTTLCLAVAGLAPRLTEGQIGGSVRIDGEDPQALPPGRLADRAGVVLQQVDGQLFNPTAAEEIAWGLSNIRVAQKDMPGRIQSALDAVGLSDLPWDRHPLTLSGGQQRRLALAAALALHPRLLILDSPAGGLNPTGRRRMVETLRRLRDDHGLAILLAETDPEVIDALADDLLMLHEGRIHSQGKPADVYTALAVAPLEGIGLPPDRRFEAARAFPPVLEIIPPPLPDAVPAIEISHVTCAYDDVLALDDVSLRVPHGGVTALMGDNGAGKTTLARCLMGLIEPVAGMIMVQGQPWTGRPVGERARQIGFAFQNPERQIFNATVRAEVAFGPANMGVDGADLDTRVERTLRNFDLLGVADAPPAVLPSGLRRVVALASVAAMDTPILLLDEPTVGLDAAHTRTVIDWMQRQAQHDGTTVLITHDAELAARVAGHVIVMHAGRILISGTPREVFMQDDLLTRAGLIAPFAVRRARAEGITMPGILTPEGLAAAVEAWE